MWNGAFAPESWALTEHLPPRIRVIRGLVSFTAETTVTPCFPPRFHNEHDSNCNFPLRVLCAL
jgi:hypothetical protein